jgi:hypothetical protein
MSKNDLDQNSNQIRKSYTNGIMALSWAPSIIYKSQFSIWKIIIV